MNDTVVPVGAFLSRFSSFSRGVTGTPRSKRWCQWKPSTIDVELEPFGQRVDDRDADAVQAAGHLVAGAAELAAGVQHGEHDLGGRLVVLRHDAHRDAAPVVDHDHRVVGLDRDGDAVAIAGERFVDRVVDDLVDQVVEAARPGGADVHAGTLADRVEALEDCDVLCVVTLLCGHYTSPMAGRTGDVARAGEKAGVGTLLIIPSVEPEEKEIRARNCRKLRVFRRPAGDKSGSSRPVCGPATVARRARLGRCGRSRGALSRACRS